MCTNDCLIYDTEYNVWYEAQTSGQKPGPRSGHAMARIGNKIYVFGGASNFHLAHSAYSCLTRAEIAAVPLVTASWHLQAAQRTDWRSALHAGCRRASFLNDLTVLDTEIMTWSRPEPKGTPPKARAYHTLTADPASGSLFLFGGNDDENSHPELQATTVPSSAHFQLTLTMRGMCRHVLSTQAATPEWWSPNTSGAAPSSRIGASAMFINGRLVLFGGWDYSSGANDLYAAPAFLAFTEFPASELLHQDLI